MTTCRSCQERLTPGARFCHLCGIEVVQSRADQPTRPDNLTVSMESERRHLTVVFCDLVGSTELSTHIDAEEFTDLISVYQRTAVSIAQRYGGVVEGFSGDGITFRFGWPEAHDDDAERALRTALDIVAAINEHEVLEVRIGVHSGLVVVGEIGEGENRATMALGETMNLAARLQTVAAPGTVATSATTLELVEGIFVTSSLGAHQLKGIAQPVEAFWVVRQSGVRNRLEAARGRWTPFIGRSHEFDTMAGAWKAAVYGKGTAVLITGEPGVGKSRLAYELREVVSRGPHTWIVCSCSAFTQMTVLWPVIQLIQQALRLSPEDDPETQLDRLRRGLSAAGVESSEAVALMGSLVGIPGIPLPPMSPERRRERTIEVLLAWVVALSHLNPLVLVVEDLHWCDPTSIDLITRFLDRIGDSPLLVLMTARPEFEDPWTEGEPVTKIRLRPFNTDEVRLLVSTLGGGRDLPEPVVERIVDSSAGIPLFAEEVGRTVLESGVLRAADRRWVLSGPLTDLKVPRTLQGSLLSRLDRLGPAKAVAEVAAVIGRTFALDLLSEVSGIDTVELKRLLARLIDSGLVFADRTAAAPGYVFKHALIQEIAYESLLKRTRRIVHERIARSLRARLESGSVAAPEAVARHFEAAGLILDAALFYERAASQAVQSSGYREAIAFLRHGIELLDEEPGDVARAELEVEMQLALGSAVIATRSYADPQIETAYARARALCEEVGSDARMGLALAGLSIYHTNRGEIRVGAELAERVLAISRVHRDDTLELLGHVQLALPRSYQGRAAECLEHALSALALYDPDRHRGVARRFGTDHGVAAHVFAGWGYLIQGYLDQGLAQFDEAVALAELLGQPFNLAYALAFRATSHWERGESHETLRDAALARQLAREQGFEFWDGVSGVWEEAERVILTRDPARLPQVFEASMLAGSSGNRGGITSVMARIAEATQAAGDLETTWAFLDAALVASRETEQVWWDSALHRMRAEVLFERCDVAEGLTLGDQPSTWERAEAEWLLALDLADQRNYPVHGLRAALGYAELLRRTRRLPDACLMLRHWFDRCPEGHATPVLTRAGATLTELESAQSNPVPGRDLERQKPRSG